MTTVADLMTRDVRVVAPTDSLQFAAQCMDELNVGAVPVCDGDRLVGMVTDRDIAVRGVSIARAAGTTPVSEVMSAHVRCCTPDQDIDEVIAEMRDAQVRRLPVVDADQRLIGIVSLGDLASRATDTREAGEALKDISTPSQPDRS